MREPTPAVPRLTWIRTQHGAYQATDAGGTLRSIDRHPTVPSRQGKSLDRSEAWWLHNLTADDYNNPAVHQSCPIMTRRQATALHRHPKILRSADVLAAGWHDECWGSPTATPIPSESCAAATPGRRCPRSWEIRVLTEAPGPAAAASQTRPPTTPLEGP